MPRRHELADKHQRLADWLTRAELDAVLLSRRCNFSWLTCGAHNYVAQTCEVGNSFVWADRSQIRVLANNIEAPRLADEELAGLPIEVETFDYADPDGLRNLLGTIGGAQAVAADAPVAGMVLADLPGGFDRLRWVLTAPEMDRYASLCADVVAAVEATSRRAEPGWTEHRVAAETVTELRSRNCVPWVLLVGADDRLHQFRHPLPTDRAVHRIFMIAVCAERDGLISACSRLASFAPLSAELADKHHACATVDAALWSRTLVGATLGDIFAEAVDAYEAVGFPGQWRHHHQGGSIGYQPREVKAAPAQTTSVLANQAFAWNPSIAGTKCEDTILCRASGPVILAPRTDWPTVSASWKGLTVGRPAILVR